MRVLLYLISVLAFIVGLPVLLFGSALLGAIFFLIATTAAAGGGIIEAVERARPK